MADQVAAGMADEIATTRGDDVHWADSPSLRFILYLAQRLEELPVAVILAARPAEPRAEEEVLPQVRAHPQAQVLRPAPLGPDAIRLLIGEILGPPDDRFATVCADAVGGNPLLLRELLSALATEDRPPTAESADLVLDIAPAPVQRALALALGRLPPAATALTRAAAVLGDQATIDAAGELGDLRPPEVVRQASALRAAETFASREAIRFAHPILRAAIYHDRPRDPGRRWSGSSPCSAKSMVTSSAPKCSGT